MPVTCTVSVCRLLQDLRNVVRTSVYAFYLRQVESTGKLEFGEKVLNERFVQWYWKEAPKSRQTLSPGSSAWHQIDAKATKVSVAWLAQLKQIPSEF